MAEYDNTNRLALFKNDKQGNEARPDYTGNLNVDGVEYRVSAWIREGKSGKFMSGQIELKDGQKKPQGKPSAKKQEIDDFEDSEIPF